MVQLRVTRAGSFRQIVHERCCQEACIFFSIDLHHRKGLQAIGFDIVGAEKVLCHKSLSQCRAVVLAARSLTGSAILGASLTGSAWRCAIILSVRRSASHFDNFSFSEVVCAVVKMEVVNGMDLAARLSMEAKEYWVHLDADGSFERYPGQ